MGYRPNPFVAAFTSQVRSYRRSPQGATIAFLDCTAEGMKSYGDEYSMGASKRAESLGYRGEIFRLRELNGSVSRLNKILLTRNISGLLVLPVTQQCNLTGLNMENMAAATVDYTLRQPEISRACPDYFEDMQLALRKLQGLGYRRICFCARSEDVVTISPHWLGAYAGWRDLLPPSERIDCYISGEWNKRSFHQWLAKAKPDALITNSDHFFTWADETRFNGSKVAFTSLSKKKMNLSFEVDQNLLQVGAAAIDLIIGQIHRNERGIPASPKTVLIKGSWNDRRNSPALAR